jgi:glycine amidinotransferase
MVTGSPVCSYNEWEPLEEVVVGRLEGARIPTRHLTVTFNIPQRLMRIYKLIAGFPYPKFVVRPARPWTCGGEASSSRTSEPRLFR